MKKSNLFLSILKGDVTKLQRSLDKGFDINAKNHIGFTPLMVATSQGNHDMVTLLIQYGAEVNIFDNQLGITALHLACQHGSTDIIRSLLSAGALINVQAQTNGITPLINAVWHRNLDAVALLLDQKNINIHLTTHYGVSVHSLLETMAISGSGPGNSLTPKEKKEVKKMQVAFERFEQSLTQVPLVAALATQGQDFEEHQQYLDKYFKQHADVNIQSPFGSDGYDYYSALHIAARDGLEKICQILLKSGADVSVKEGFMSATPIHLAAFMGRTSVLKILATHPEFAVLVDEQTAFNGYTALHFAVWQGQLKAAKVLLSLGADPAIKGHDGCTALDLASKYDYYEIEELLESAPFVSE